MSDILQAVYETVKELRECDAVDKTTLSQFEEICSTPSNETGGNEIDCVKLPTDPSPSLYND